MIASTIDLVLNSYASFYLFLVSLIGSYGGAAIILACLLSAMMVYPSRWAQKVAEKETVIKSVLNPQLLAIRRASAGAEQHRRINVLYDRYSYHPIYGLRAITGLFIQLPFLILTYFMFDGLDDLYGRPFLVVGDLGEPDALLFADGNALPFVMTALNVTAAFLTPRLTKAGLVQALFMSVLFFFLLYGGKSALLIFWTTNNFIMLAQNIVKYRANRNILALNLSRNWLRSGIFLLRPEVACFFASFFAFSAVGLALMSHGPVNTLLKAFSGIGLLAFIGVLTIHGIFHLTGHAQRAYSLNRKIDFNVKSIGWADVLLTLIPLTVVIQYALINKEFLTLTGQVNFVGVLACLLFLLVWVMPMIFERFSRAVCLAPLALSLSAIILLLPQFVQTFNWASRPDVAFLIAVLLVFLCFFVLTYTRYRKALRLSSCIFFTLGVVYFSIVGEEEVVSLPSSETRIEMSLKALGPIKRTPDVFLLTYDAYVAAGVMEKYGIDNRDQEKILQGLGFEIYPKAYSVAWDSLESMTSMLDLTHGAGGSTSGDALVPRLLRDHGYETFGVLSPYLYPRKPSYDVNFPGPATIERAGPEALKTGLKRGAFYFGDIMNTENLAPDAFDKAKNRVFERREGAPKFLYAHNKSPGHSQNSGKCLDDEVEQFEKRVRVANKKMNSDIQAILANQREAIIIINGDHGPYLTGDCSFMFNVEQRNSRGFTFKTALAHSSPFAGQPKTGNTGGAY